MHLRTLLVGVGLSLAAIWIAVVLAGPSIARKVAERYGEKILSIFEGYVSNPTAFVELLIHEFAGLLSAAVLIGATGFLCARRLGWVIPPYARGYVGGLIYFVALNVLVHFAMGTILFWAALTDVESPFAAYHLKQTLREKTAKGRNAIVIGSSQANTEILEQTLNKELGPEMQFWDLHFAGTKGFDFLLLRDQSKRVRKDMVICYVSEYNFYINDVGGRFQSFMNPSGLQDFLSLGGGFVDSFTELVNGFVGYVCPLYRCRLAIKDRVFAPTVTNLINQPPKRSTSEKTSEEEKAKAFAATFAVGPTSDFHKAAFEEFVRRCLADGSKVVICVGQLNPVVAPYLDPKITRDMTESMDALAKKFPEATILSANDLTPHVPGDYKDFTHVNKPAQEAYTLKLLSRLRTILNAK